MKNTNSERILMPHELHVVSKKYTQLQQLQVNLQAMSYPVLVANLQATSLMVQLPPWHQLLHNDNRIMTSLIDTTCVPETS
jgi:hypothetical protein